MQTFWLEDSAMNESLVPRGLVNLDVSMLHTIDSLKSRADAGLSWDEILSVIAIARVFKKSCYANSSMRKATAAIEILKPELSKARCSNIQKCEIGKCCKSSESFGNYQKCH